MLINLKLLTAANSFLLNIAEHEGFHANKYENASFEHEKCFITSGLGLTKQCSYRPDSTEHNIWSGSTLFATPQQFLEQKQVVKWT